MIGPRASGSGRVQNPYLPFPTTSIFRKGVGAMSLAVDQTPALKIANQLSYGNANYSYNGAPAPSFYGYSGLGYYPAAVKANISTFSPSFFVVDSNEPTQAVIYSSSPGTPYPPGTANNLQSHFNAVPVPDPTKIPSGLLVAGGTDREMVIWRPSTDEMWEMFNFQGSYGNYTMKYGGYIPQVSQFSGVFPNLWGARATSLACACTCITMQDLVDVLQGGSIQHALAIAGLVTGPTHVAPATRNDSGSFTPQFEADGTTPNPAYGTVDQVNEGSWFRFPPGSSAGSFGITTPLAVAVHNAIRDFGVFLTDTGSMNFFVEPPFALGSPYSWCRVNPLQGSSLASLFGYIPASWTDSTLPVLGETIFGAGNVFTLMPWQTLQCVQPFSS